MEIAGYWLQDDSFLFWNGPFSVDIPSFSAGGIHILQVRHRRRIVFRVDAVTHPPGGARICHGAGYRNPKHHWRSQHIPGGVYILYKRICMFVYIYIIMCLCVDTDLRNDSLRKLYYTDRKLIFEYLATTILQWGDVSFFGNCSRKIETLHHVSPKKMV